MKATLFLLLLATSAFGQQPKRSCYNHYGAESDSAGSYYYTEYDGQSWVSRFTTTNTVRYKEQDTDQKNTVAEEAVKKSPPWIPGTQRGRPVKQRMVLPLTFKLG